MLTEKTGIGPGLLFVTVFSAIYGYGLLLSMFFAAKYFGVSGYWGAVLIFLLMVPVIYAVSDLGRRFPGQSIIAYLPEVMGKVLGRIIGFGYLLFMIVLTGWVILIISNIFSFFYLPRTPLGVIFGLIMITVFYITGKGVEGITRVAAMLFTFCMMFILLYTALSFQNFRLDNVLPLADFTMKELTNGKYLNGLISMFNAGLPLSMLLMVYPYLTERRKGRQILFGAAGLAVVLIGLAIVSAIGNYGAKGVLQYAWPYMEQGNEINIPYVVISFGLFMPTIMLILILFGGSSFYFSAAQGCAELFGRFKFRTYRWFLLPVIYFCGTWTTNEVIQRMIFEYFKVIGFIMVFGMPLLVWLVAAIRRKGISERERSFRK
jgi:spore germination protein (amino acid permease)